MSRVKLSEGIHGTWWGNSAGEITWEEDAPEPRVLRVPRGTAQCVFAQVQPVEWEDQRDDPTLVDTKGARRLVQLWWYRSPSGEAVIRCGFDRETNTWVVVKE